MAWDRRSPFDETGGLMHYADERLEDKPWNKDRYSGDWRPEIEFEATIEVVRTVRGRSASYLIVKDQNGVEHSMFISELVEALYNFKKGKCKGVWVPKKRGQNFGLKLVRP